MLKKIAERLVLTKTERNVILFLIITLLIGAGLHLYQATFASVQQFDYHASDSTFTALSVQAEKEEISGENSASDNYPDKININVATKQELMDLPGIGEKTAEHILVYRNEIGKFKSVDELRSVRGISEKKLEKLRPLIKTQ